MAELPDSAFSRFQARENRRAAAEAARGRWIWATLFIALLAIFASLAAKDATAAWRMIMADPRGPLAAATHAPRPYWRGLALIAAGALDVLVGAWMGWQALRGRQAEFTLTVAAVATLGALEFNWLTASPKHLAIGAGIVVAGLLIELVPAGRKRAG